VNPLTPGGTWVCSWWAQDDDDANLAFVALHYSATGPVPDWAVLTIRGTDIDEWDIWGILWQIWEDLDFIIQTPVKWAPPNYSGARIAQGTLDGINDILGLSFNGSSLEAYLGTLANRAGLQFAVTGHSLGGCLTTVMASQLRAQLLPNVLPVTFAAPSAGNGDFAAYFQSQFQNALCFASSLDIAPNAWGNLVNLDTIYDPQFPTPDTVLGGILTIILGMDIAGINYAQPTSTPLTATLNTNVFDWYAEAFYQHHPSSYMKWLGGTDICMTPPLMASSGKPTVATLRAKLGPLSEVVRKVRSGVS
jgi:hypothetical protein